MLFRQIELVLRGSKGEELYSNCGSIRYLAVSCISVDQVA